MVWASVVVAIAVLGVAAWAGTGRLGEMPGTVTDRPKAHIPEGPVDELFLERLSLPTAGTGYRCSQVDALLVAHVAGEDVEPGTRFDVVRRGYDMQAVDAIIERFGVRENVPALVEADEMNERLVQPGEMVVVTEVGAADVEEDERSLSERVVEVEEREDSASATALQRPPQEPERATIRDSPSPLT